MNLNVTKKVFQSAGGKEIQIETGKLAKQADGSVVVTVGKAMLLATVVSNKEAREEVDFLPLSVDYQEKFAAAGRIPGGFLKREGRLSDHEVLICRLVDRALRPLFPEDYHAETQVNISMISSDPEVAPDALACLAASSALAVSDIPFNGPVSEVRVCRIDGKLAVNPSPEDIKKADIDIMVAGTAENITMVEGEMNEVSEAEMLEALQAAHDEIKLHCQAQNELAQEIGATGKREYSHEEHDEELKKKMHTALYDKVYAVVKSFIANKKERSAAFKAIKDEYLESFSEEDEINGFLFNQYYHDIHKEAARNLVLNERVRLDNRKLDEIRNIWTEVDYLPAAHGSALFTRGETQSLTSVTLGTRLDEQMIDSAMVQGYNRFILHYNFPAFSTGEVRPNRGPGRREIGHGNLAMRALKKVLPPDAENPYTIRVVSDILESNGSSSMATVCAGSMALMDTGIPVKAAVAGIAMGLISNENMDNYAVLSDILGDEDHLGDMDFKVAGTEAGITACQMDIKIKGLSFKILQEALEQARAGRLHILGEMKKSIEKPKEDLKPHAPRSYTMSINTDLIGAVIGPGGKVIQEIQRQTGSTIIIDEVDNRGVINVFAADKESMDGAVKRIKDIVAMPEVGETYKGKVKSIMPFGAFVEFMPGKDGLLHISEISWDRIETMDNVFEAGEEVEVKLTNIDEKTGKFRLSKKALLPKP